MLTGRYSGSQSCARGRGGRWIRRQPLAAGASKQGAWESQRMTKSHAQRRLCRGADSRAG